MNLGLAVSRHAICRPDEAAVFDHRGERTWAELDDRTNRLAAVLTDLGVGHGDRVALLCENRSEVLEVLVATHKVAAVYVGLNFRLPPKDLDMAVDNAAPAVLLHSADLAEDAQRTAQANPGFTLLNLDDDTDQGYERQLAGAPAIPAATRHDSRPDELGCIVYTSGTTGAPKGVAFDHRAMTMHAAVAALEYDIKASSRYLIQIPHNSSVNITIAPCLMMGAAVGFADSRGFDPDRFAAAVQDHAVTHTFLVPTQLGRLLDKLPADDDRLQGLTTIGYGSSPISPDRLAELVERYGPVFIQLYGMAEVASIGTLLRKDDHVRGLRGDPQLLRSAGRPSLALAVRVVDDDGRDVPTGERGEVIFGGTHVMRGYHKDPARTDAVLIDGWMHSGDIGIFDAEGYLTIVDRKKDLIIRGGQNISPTEIENALYRHADVLEAGVVGAPDPQWGERIVAVVARRTGGAVEADELLDLCRSSLPSFLCPSEITFADSLPKNAVGKIDKNAIRNRYWDQDRRV